eukprot:763136-Hanusia_phi.AAC.6
MSSFLINSCDILLYLLPLALFSYLLLSPLLSSPNLLLLFPSSRHHFCSALLFFFCSSRLRPFYSSPRLLSLSARSGIAREVKGIALLPYLDAL